MDRAQSWSGIVDPLDPNMHTGLLFGFSLAGFGQSDRNCLAPGLAGGHLGPDVGRNGLLRGSGFKGHGAIPSEQPANTLGMRQSLTRKE